MMTSLPPSLFDAAGDDAKIRVWQVPEGGMTDTLTEPELILQGRTALQIFQDFTECIKLYINKGEFFHMHEGKE